MKLALKYKPPTIAVVYQMKDTRSSKIGTKQKKYIHEIKVNFEGRSEPVDVSKMCDEMCESETVYLNPQFINKQQVSDIILIIQVLDLL